MVLGTFSVRHLANWMIVGQGVGWLVLSLKALCDIFQSISDRLT